MPPHLLRDVLHDSLLQVIPRPEDVLDAHARGEDARLALDDALHQPRQRIMVLAGHEARVLDERRVVVAWPNREGGGQLEVQLLRAHGAQGELVTGRLQREDLHALHMILGVAAMGALY